MPSDKPSPVPSLTPSSIPSLMPLSVPSTDPSSLPSLSPSLVPSLMPSSTPTISPSLIFSAYPSLTPVAEPSSAPSTFPTYIPSKVPSIQPSSKPSTVPSILQAEVPVLIALEFRGTCECSSEVVDELTQILTVTLRGDSEVVDFMTDNVQCTPKCASDLRKRRALNDNEDSVGIIFAGRQTAPIEEADKLSTSQSILETVSLRMDDIVSEVIIETGVSISGGLPRLLEFPSASPSSSGRPSIRPSNVPSSQPSLLASNFPSQWPSLFPSTRPSSEPTDMPSLQPSSAPSMYLSAFDGDECRFDIECMIGICDGNVCKSEVSKRDRARNGFDCVPNMPYAHLANNHLPTDI